MSVDIAAIRAAAEVAAKQLNQLQEIAGTGISQGVAVAPDYLLALCDLAERTLERQGLVSTHWEDCWKAHDACAAELYRKEHPEGVTKGTK